MNKFKSEKISKTLLTNKINFAIMQSSNETV